MGFTHVKLIVGFVTHGGYEVGGYSVEVRSSAFVYHTKSYMQDDDLITKP